MNLKPRQDRGFDSKRIISSFTHVLKLFIRKLYGVVVSVRRGRTALPKSSPVTSARHFLLQINLKRFLQICRAVNHNVHILWPRSTRSSETHVSLCANTRALFCSLTAAGSGTVPRNKALIVSSAATHTHIQGLRNQKSLAACDKGQRINQLNY